MTCRTALKETKDLYLVQLQVDNGLCIIDDGKFVDKKDLKINKLKLVKYDSSYLDATVVGIGDKKTLVEQERIGDEKTLVYRTRKKL